MANTYVDYTATAGQTDFNFSFPYLENDHVEVLIDGVASTAFTIALSPTRVVLNTAATGGEVVRVRRSSDPTEDLVDFVNGSILTESDLDRAYLHNRYLNEEAYEGNTSSLQTAAGGTNFDANFNKIINLAPPTNSLDAANKNYVDDKLALSGTSLSGFNKSTHTGDNATTTFTLSFTPQTGTAAAFRVAIDGVLQTPDDAYTVNTSTNQITFTSAPPTNAEIVVIATGTAQDVNSIGVTATGSTTARTLANRFADVVNVLDYGAVADNATDIATALEAYKTDVGSNQSTLLFSGTNNIFFLNTNVTLPSNINVKFERGAEIRVNSGTTLTIEGAVTAGNYQIFRADSGDVLIPGTAGHRKTFSPLWFNSVDATDIGEKINKALTAGVTDTHVLIPAGAFNLATSIDLGIAPHSVLEGSGHIATSLTISASLEGIGIDASGSDESQVRRLRCVEATGSQKSICIRLGGTSLVVENCWFGNAKYGMFQNGGAGVHVNGVYIEACAYGIKIASRCYDYKINGLTHGTSIINCRYHQVFVNECGLANQEEPTGLLIDEHIVYTVSGVTGSFQVGETVTASSGGSFQIIKPVAADGGTVINDTVLVAQAGYNEPTGTINISDTLTGGTSGATATLTSADANDCKDLQFTQLQVIDCDRYGARICRADHVSINGHFNQNGDDCTSECAGLLIGPVARNISLNGCSFLDNGKGSSNPTSYGLELDGEGNPDECLVTIVGCTLGNKQFLTAQDYGLYIRNADCTIAGCIFEGNVTDGILRQGNINYSVTSSYGIDSTSDFINTEKLMISGNQPLIIYNGTTPASTPTGAGFLYVESGALKFKGSSGTVTTVASA